MQRRSVSPRPRARRRSARTLALAITILASSVVSAQGPLRKIGEMELALVGLSATVDPSSPVVPKNTPAGVRVVVRSGAGDVAASDVVRFFGADVHVEADFTGPGLAESMALTSAGESDPLLLPLPAVQTAGDYQLSNVRLVASERSALDVTPNRVPVQVIEQVLITSVTTRPLSLEEIRGKGIVLDSDDYIGFEFTIGVKLESRAVQLSFPAVFTPSGVAIPEFTFPNPSLPSPHLDIPSLPFIMPTMLVVEAPDGATKIPGFEDIRPEDIRIPSLLVIPGNVGFLKQFFSAQLFVANGAPGGSRLTVRDLTGTIRLPNGLDDAPGTGDDPLSLPTLEGGTAPATRAVKSPGPDGAPETSDDVGTLQPGEQAQAEFLLRGEREGFHNIEFDIAGVLDGLATGPAKIKGLAKGAVLVRNPFFDMTFTVPSVVRRGERFKMYATVTNKSESGAANDLTVSLDQTRMSGMRLEGDALRRIETLRAGDSKTLQFDFISERTGQVVATYIRFDPDAGASGDMRFTAGIGERGIALSPDTIVLPNPVDALPVDVMEAAMRVIGQAWSISLSNDQTRPAGVLPITRQVTIEHALALAEAALRITLGQSTLDSVRDMTLDFYGPPETTLNAGALDRGFDQLLRQTDAGHSLRRAIGAALAPAVAAGGGALAYQRDWASLLASGSDRVTLAVSGGPVDVAIVDGSGNRTESTIPAGGLARSEAIGTVVLPLTAEASLLGLVTRPDAGPYTIELTGRGDGAIDLAVAMPRAAGETARATASGVPVFNGSRARLVLDATSGEDLVLQQDTDGDGTSDSAVPLAGEVLAPGGPQLLTSRIVGPELFSNASDFGKHALLLFDRVVDPQAAADASLFSVPKNQVLRTKRVLSGRLAVLEMEQPEGNHIPTTLAVAGMSDLRGVSGPAATVPLVSLIDRAAAILTGRVFMADGSPVGGVEIFYSNAFGGVRNPSCEFIINQLDRAQSIVRTGADGSFEFRWVPKDTVCGAPFRLTAQDPDSGSVRRLDRHVLADGERIGLDLGLFGRGTVTGVVRDLTNQPVGGAHVVVTSTTDPQLQEDAIADGEGRYAIPNVLVGPVSVVARKAYDGGATVRQGTAGGNLTRAGSSVSVDVVIDSGSASVSGVVTHVTAEGSKPAAGALVMYSVKPSSGGVYQLASARLADDQGRFAFASVPSGAFFIQATVPTAIRESNHVVGLVDIGEVRDGIEIVVISPATATVRGQVRKTDGVLVAGAMVREGERFTITDSSGAFELQGLAVNATQPHGLSAETPDRRKGVATVLVTGPGVIEGVNITVSSLGSAEFTVLDGFGAPVGGQEVVILADQFGLRGACSMGCGCSIQTGITNGEGKVRFNGLPAGAVLARALRTAGGFFDVANGRTTIVTEGHLALGVMRFEGFGRIAGVVLDPDGRPAVGADVTVNSRRFETGSCSMGDNQSSHAVRTDHLGRFTLAAVGVGGVSIQASHPFLPVPVGLQTVITRAGEDQSVTLRLVNSFAGELSGRILLPDGVTPAPGAEVTINGPLPDITVRTNTEGRFRFAKILPAGVWVMTATDAVTGALARTNIDLKAGQDLAHELRLKGHGTVRVRVVDALDQPVPLAVVRVQEQEYPRRLLEGIADAASEGTATFTRVFEGPVSVEASDAFARGGRASATIPAPGSIVDVKVRLGITGIVRGRFLMPGGTPIPFGIVKLIVNGREIGQSTTAASGDVGSFEFGYVPAGPIRLEAQDPASARTGVAVGTVTNEGEVVPVDVFAQGLGTVSGVVTAGGTPQPGAAIELVSRQFRVNAIADAEGRYSVAGVPEGLVNVSASIASGIQTGSASGTLSGEGSALTLDVAVRDAGRLTGTVIPATGTTAPATIVTAEVAGILFSATTDAQGRFDFPRLPEGTIYLRADVIGSIDTAQLTVTLTGSATTDIQMPLFGVGALTGRALDSHGLPTAGTVMVSSTDQGRYQSITVNVGVDGQFRFPELLAGPVSVKLTVRGTTDLHGTTQVTVVPEADTPVEVRLQDSATVTGVVLRANGTTPAIGADAVLRLALGPHIPMVVQSDGRFTAAGVPLGAFTLAITDPFTGGVALVRDRATSVNGETLDLGTLVLDDTLVTVTAVDPSDGAVGIAVNRPIVITFSDPLRSATGVSVLNGGTLLSATPALSADGLTLTLTPTTGNLKWPDSAQLAVVVDTTATDIHGRHPAQAFTSRFRTVDLSPPAVASTTPVNGAIQVAGTSVIQVTFTEPLAAATDLTALVVVTGPGGPIAGDTTLTAPAVATFTLAAPLADNALYSVIVNGALDDSGNLQTTPFAASFATTDTVAPVLQFGSQSPFNANWTRVSQPHLTVSFTDAVSGVQHVSGTMALDGVAVQPAQFTTFLLFVPAAPLAEGLHALTASVADRAGNVGALPPVSFGVDTIAPAAPVLGGLADGQVMSGNVAISASSADAASGVAFIDVLRDGFFTMRLAAPDFTGTLVTSGVPEGTRTFSARATDVAGNVGAVGPDVTVVVDNQPLTVSVTSPASGFRTRTDVLARASVSESVASVEFTLGNQTVVDSAAPYEATLPLGTIADGSHPVTATAIPLTGGATATHSVTIVVDRTPPSTPDVTRITAEPPFSGVSSVIGYGGAVEALSAVEITNTASGALALTAASSTGAFTAAIAAAVDDLLSIVAIDQTGNRSAAASVIVRQQPSLPPSGGTTSLRFEGVLVDRVSAGGGAAALAPDGVNDALFTFTLDIGAGVTRQLSYIDLAGPALRSTQLAAGAALGVASDAGGAFLNDAAAEARFPITSGATLTLFAHDAGFIQEGATYTAKAVFTDGSQFIGSFTIVPAADRAQVAHSAVITASYPTVTVAPGMPGATLLTVTDIRDIDGTRVPDGAKIALAAADMAAKDPRGQPVRSAGGEILEGEPAANNANFRVFTIAGGAVTATYSSGPVTPGSVVGVSAVVQVLPADASGNVIGDEIIAAFDLPLRDTADRAIVHAVPPAVYGDGASRGGQLTIDVRDAAGQPVPDGTKVLVTASSCWFRAPDGGCINSDGGTMSGGDASPYGAHVRLFTVIGGRIAAGYAAGGLTASSGVIRKITIAVGEATSAGFIASNAALGTGTVSVVGPAAARVTASPTQVGLPNGATVVVDHVHDTRAAIVPDGGTVFLSAVSCATSMVGGGCITSDGGTVVDGLSTLYGETYKAFTLQNGRAVGSYSPGGMTATPGQVRTARVQAAPGQANGSLLSTQALGWAAISLAAATDAVGNAVPASLFGDGALRTSEVTFTNILDGFGNPVPDGTYVMASAFSCAGTNPQGGCIASAGGQVLNGLTTVYGATYKQFQVQNGGVVVQYGSPSSSTLPGATRVANVTLFSGHANGSPVSSVALGAAPISLTGLTSAQGTASPATVFADGGDRRSTVTITNLRDSAGHPVPDGAHLIVTALDGATLVGGASVRSAGGLIFGGEDTANMGAGYRFFTVANGQVVLEYSAQGVAVTSGTRTAVVQVTAAQPNKFQVSRTAIATIPIQLAAPASGNVTFTPGDVLADGAGRLSSVVVSGLTDAAGVPLPDGSRVGLTVTAGAAVVNGASMTSAGGALQTTGAHPGDGTLATNSGHVHLFTVSNGEVRAAYSAAAIASTSGETKIARLAVVPVNASGSVISSNAIASGAVNLRGISAAVASGPASLARGGATATVTFSGIKDAAGNTVPDGTKVVVTAASGALVDPVTGFGVASVGGTIVDGDPSISGSSYKVFTVMAGSVTVTYASPSSAGTARVQIGPARPDGSLIGNRHLAGGVWAITIQ